MTRKIKDIPRVPIELLTCKGKKPYTSIIDAIEAKEALVKNIPYKRFKIYICHHCGEYHVGGAQEEQK